MPLDSPLFLAKWDIKDGFWRLLVPPEHAWHFCYVMPRLPNQPIQIVLPASLQMGWCESPPFFCTASETARDLAQQYLNQPMGTLPPHPLEHLSVPPVHNLPHITSENADKLSKVLEVFVDDFICMLQAPTPASLQHATQAILHGIHTIFPPDHANPANDSISIKKLKQGDGMWDTRKEILGWLFDGVTHCMQLPNE